MLHLFAQHLPEKWAHTKKLASQAKQLVSSLQTTEVSNIRMKTASFDVHQYNFREEFRKMAPFLYSSQEPYEMLNKVGLIQRNMYLHTFDPC
jgi:dynein heavy chain